MTKKMNNEGMKTHNATTVLKTIQRHEPISRKDIAGLTGLTPSSITNIVNRLIEFGLLEQVSYGESLGGRRPILLRYSPETAYIIGIELSVENIVGIITDFRANIIDEIIVPTQINDKTDEVINRIVSVIISLMKRNNKQQDQILGIGIAAPGPYDHIKGILINPPNFPGWKDVHLADLIRKQVNIPVFIEKESVASALAEYMFGAAKNVRNLFVVNAMTVGVGGGVIIDGKIYHGFSDGAGDLGHMTIDIDGPKCVCGSYGCLEAMAKASYMKDMIIREIKRGAKSSITERFANMEDITTEGIFECYSANDTLCRIIVERSARYLGIGIANIINVYSPDMIIVGGYLPLLCPDYFKFARDFAKNRAYPGYNKNIKILPSSFKEEAIAMGAASVVYHNFYKNIRKFKILQGF